MEIKVDDIEFPQILFIYLKFTWGKKDIIHTLQLSFLHIISSVLSIVRVWTDNHVSAFTGFWVSKS